MAVCLSVAALLYAVEIVFVVQNGVGDIYPLRRGQTENS